MARPTDADLAGLVSPGGVVLLGELHGTHEFGETVARLAALAVDRGLPTAVALEIPSTEQPAVDAFLAGDDDAAARAALTRSSFWHPAVAEDDGRRGRGTLRLLRALHRTARRGRLVVRAVDQPWMPPGTPVTDDVVALLDRPRDEVMADGAAAAFDEVGAGRGDGFGLLLAGGLHTRVRRRVPLEPSPAGAFLVRRFAGLVALQGHHSGGCCRAMVSERGAETLRIRPYPTPAGSVGRFDRRDARCTGHHGWVNVGHLTPSSPLPAP